MNKPVIFCDLDDTLFQTKRKMLSEMQQEPIRIGAYDREQKPRSFMSTEQAMLVDWLLATTELIPVTARGVEETSRVSLPFRSWKVMTHGAVVAGPNGTLDQEWQAIICQQLSALRTRLISYRQYLSDELEKAGINAWCRMNYEYDQVPVYFVMKHRDSTKIDELYRFNEQMKRTLNIEDFYIHTNGNNVAWIPNCIQKGHAVDWLLNKLHHERGAFPVMGFGDSLSDFTFMQHCDWFGMPTRSQFTAAIRDKIFDGVHPCEKF